MIIIPMLKRQPGLKPQTRAPSPALLAAFLFFLTCLSSITGADIGDRGLQQRADLATLFKDYPEAEPWLRSGLTDGYQRPPEPETTLPLDADIQSALDAATSADGATQVVLLSAGRYSITQPLRIPSNVVLRGNAAQTILIYDTKNYNHQAVIMDNCSGSGIENIRLVNAHADSFPQLEDQDDPTAFMNPIAAPPQSEPTISLSGSENCWLIDVTWETVLNNPLQINTTHNSLFRGLTFHGSIQRGTTNSSITLEDSSQLLVAGWSVQNINRLVISHNVSDSVFIANEFGCAIYFTGGTTVRNNLFEDCHFIHQPGFTLRPFSKGPQPLGENNLIINNRAFSQNTDAVVPGVLMEPEVAYVIQPTGGKAVFDPVTRYTQRSKLVKKHQQSAISQESKLIEQNTTAIAPLQNDLTAVSEKTQLQQDLWIHQWASTGPLSQAVSDQALKEVIETPLVVGKERHLPGQDTPVTTQIIEQDHKRRAPKPDQLSVEKYQAKFGVILQQSPGYSIDTLAAMGKNWRAEALWQTAFTVHESLLLEIRNKFIGVNVAIYINQQELSDDHYYRLGKGHYLITAHLKMNRRPPFLKKSSFRSQAKVILDDNKKKEFIDTPVPSGNSLYPYADFADPLSERRNALQAWYDYAEKLRLAPFPTIRSDAQQLIQDHPQSLTAWQATRIAAILEQAPYDEANHTTLTPQQWGELIYYYTNHGLIERKWSLGKKITSIPFSEYYFLNQEDH